MQWFQSPATNSSPNRFLGSTQRSIDCSLPGRVLAFDDDTGQATQHDLDPAPLIGAATRAVDVGHAHAHPLD